MDELLLAKVTLFIFIFLFLFIVAAALEDARSSLLNLRSQLQKPDAPVRRGKTVCGATSCVLASDG